MSDDKAEQTINGDDEVPETAEAHDEDVEEMLKRETFDGKGGAVVPKSDFESYATEGVENESE